MPAARPTRRRAGSTSTTPFLTGQLAASEHPRCRCHPDTAGCAERLPRRSSPRAAGTSTFPARNGGLQGSYPSGPAMGGGGPDARRA